MRRLLAACLVVLAGRAPARADDALVRHVVSRLTFGPRAEELARVERIGVTAYVEEQLHPEALDDAETERRVARLDAVALGSDALYAKYPQPKQAKKGTMMEMDAAPAGGTPAGAGARARPRPRQILEQLACAKVLRAVYSRRQLAEVMTDFWFNHFNVSWNKDDCKWLTPSFERDALRPRALGRFRDLLGAVARHPAMLVYLDNRVNGRRRPGDAGGLNENYARELLELHTLGVDGGYAQADVVAVARCFTGWTLERKDGAYRFLFKKNWHAAGDKLVLGRTIPGARSTAEGEAVLDLLACHPATARFIAFKLCRRFIADEPPPEAVAAVAEAFSASDGDIRATLRALFATAAFAAPEARRAKLKTPLEYLASVLRALDADTDVPRPLLEALRGMGQPPYACEPPTGYPDTAAPWVNAGALLARMRVAEALAGGDAPRTRVDFERAAGCPLDGELPEVTQRLWDRLVGAPMGGTTRRVLDAAARDPEITRAALDDPAAEPDYPRLVAMILGSPEFQCR